MIPPPNNGLITNSSVPSRNSVTMVLYLVKLVVKSQLKFLLTAPPSRPEASATANTSPPKKRLPCVFSRIFRHRSSYLNGQNLSSGPSPSLSPAPSCATTAARPPTDARAGGATSINAPTAARTRTGARGARRLRARQLPRPRLLRRADLRLSLPTPQGKRREYTNSSSGIATASKRVLC